MLQANLTTSQTKKDTSLNAFDENCLSELSSEQASNIAGGFTLKNNTEAPRIFYNFGEKSPPTTTNFKTGRKRHLSRRVSFV